MFAQQDLKAFTSAIFVLKSLDLKLSGIRSLGREGVSEVGGGQCFQGVDQSSISTTRGSSTFHLKLNLPRCYLWLKWTHLIPGKD